MTQPERLSDYLFPRPRERAEPPPRSPRWQPDYDDDSFWARHFRPPSALILAVVVSALAALVALVTTIIFANADAGRPIEAETVVVPTSAPDGTASGAEDEVTEPDGSPTTTVPATLTSDLITDRLAESVWALSTLDLNGRPVAGSAFVAGSFGGRTLLVTSLAVVGAATAEPAPAITIRRGSQTTEATLWTWQESSDLALLVTNVAGPSLPLGFNAPLRVNDRLYSMAGGESLSLGIVTGVTPDGVDHNIFVEAGLAGAPIVNQRGEVVAVASAAYNPGGRGTTTSFIAVPIDLACERILDCGGGNVDPDVTTPSSVPVLD